MGWFWPLSRTKEVGVEIKGSDGLKLKGGLEWELNGYEVVGATWPPLDPDKGVWMGANAPMPAAVNDGGDWAEGVRRRQKEDMERREGISRPQDAIVTSAISNGSSKVIAPKWMNEEGETLADYGVDDDDEDVPLAELMRKRAGWGKSNTD
jgi:palmitoyltransferase